MQTKGLTVSEIFKWNNVAKSKKDDVVNAQIGVQSWLNNVYKNKLCNCTKRVRNDKKKYVNNVHKDEAALSGRALFSSIFQF